jgi:hypothetical protein
MKKYENAFNAAASRIASADRKTTEACAQSDIPDEPAFTASLVTRIIDALNDFEKGGIRWNARILSSHGKNTEESEFGADFMGSLTLELDDFSVKKGFLCQAKRQEPGKSLRQSEWDRMNKQCEQMLTLTPESYVFIYSLNGVFVIPAISVTSCTTRTDLHTLHPKKLYLFYKDHFKCFIGDIKIIDTTFHTLSNLRARQGLEIYGSIAIPEQTIELNFSNEE